MYIIEVEPRIEAQHPTMAMATATWYRADVSVEDDDIALRLQALQLTSSVAAKFVLRREKPLIQQFGEKAGDSMCNTVCLVVVLVEQSNTGSFQWT